MIKHTNQKVILGIAAFAMIAWCGPRPAGAAKEVFQRTKPHCNVQVVPVFDGGDGFLAVVQAELLVFDGTGEAYGDFHLYGENGESLWLKAVEGAVVDDPRLVVSLTLEEIGGEQGRAAARYAVTAQLDPANEDCILWDLTGSDIHYQFPAVGDIRRYPPPDREPES